MTNNPIRVLLVEDDDVDAMGIERGFRKEKIGNQVLRVRDGLEALEALRNGCTAAGPLDRPFVIFLDLNMPRMDGFEFLKAIRENPALTDLVVFVLTTSNREEDRLRAYGLHVAGFISKSNAGNDFIQAITMLDHYWRVVEVP